MKKATGLPGLVARGTPTAASIGTGYGSGLASYTDGQWNEFDAKMNATLHDPRVVKYTETWVNMVREAGRRTGPTCNGMTRWRRSPPGRPA